MCIIIDEFDHFEEKFAKIVSKRFFVKKIFCQKDFLSKKSDPDPDMTCPKKSRFRPDPVLNPVNIQGADDKLGQTIRTCLKQ
jgi:hypothetical protein